MTALGVMIRRDVPPERIIDYAAPFAPHVDELWVVEDCFYPGGIAQMATLLAAFDDVAVGHGLAPAPFRNPAALAMEWAALAALHPDRVRLAIGHGVPSWMDQIGEGVESRLTLLRETFECVGALMRGETVAMDGRYVTLDDVTLHAPPAVVPPLLAGVMGPRSLRLAGEVADGLLLPEGHGPEEVVVARRLAAEGAPAGRRIPVTVFAAFHCGNPAALGDPPPEVPTGWDAVADTTEEAADRLAELLAADIDGLILVPFGDDHEHQLRLAVDEILPTLRRFA